MSAHADPHGCSRRAANTLRAGRGMDVFFATYGTNHANAKPGDLLKVNVVPPPGA